MARRKPRSEYAKSFDQGPTRGGKILLVSVAFVFGYALGTVFL